MTIDRPTIPMTATIPVLGPVLTTTRLNLNLPVGMWLELTCGDRDQQVEYRVLQNGSRLASGMFPTTYGAWASLEPWFTGEQRVRLSCWLRGLR